MAVLWLTVPGKHVDEEPGTDDLTATLNLALGGLERDGLEVRRPGRGEPLPPDLRGVAALVVTVDAKAATNPGTDTATDPAVQALVQAARDAELPLLTVGAAARVLDQPEPTRVRRLSRSRWALPGRSGGGDDEERGRACQHFAERVAATRHHALTRAFFTPRAAGWEKRFPDDRPAYTAGVALLGLEPGQAALDVGCGTGRALPLLREAVGPRGRVFGTDLTPAMLREVHRLGRARTATVAVADCARLPLRDGVLHGVFAAGVLHHLPDPHAGLRELARVTAPGGRLVLFHPIGRAVLAARHGRTAGPDDLLAEGPLGPAFTATGWRLSHYEDVPDRFAAVGVRTGD